MLRVNNTRITVLTTAASISFTLTFKLETSRERFGLYCKQMYTKYTCKTVNTKLMTSFCFSRFSNCSSLAPNFVLLSKRSMMYSNDGIVMNVLGGGEGLKRDSTLDSAPQRSVSSAHLVSSLTIMTADSETNETLLNYMEKNTEALWFLKVCSNYWCTADRYHTSDPSQQHWLMFHRTYFILGRIILVVMFFTTFIFLIVKIVERATLATTVLNVAVCSDLLSVVPAQYLNQQRMLQHAHLLDASVIDESIRISRYFLYLCLATIVVSATIYTAGLKGQKGSQSDTGLLVLGELFISLNLAFNMFFLIMDLKVSSLLLDQLFLLHERKQLTMDKFAMVREDIRRRVNKSKWASDFIFVPSLASVVTILILVFHPETGRSILGGAWCIALSKELMFVCVAFWYVAKVNGRADKLTELMCANAVVPPVLDDVSVTESLAVVEYGLKYNDLLKEVHRLSIYTSSLACPISFTLLFKRVSWEDVTVSATGFVITIVVGLIKSLVPNS